MESVVHSHDVRNRTLVLGIPGDLLSTNVEAVRARAFSLLEDPALSHTALETVEIDLRHARMVDSMGLNLLVSIIRMAKKLGSSVRVLVASNSVMRTCQFTRLHLHAEIRRVAAE
jgi:anti-anti-sigma factor